VHIAAVMAALEVWDLDRSAKHALVVVCCRADRYTGMARVSVGRVALDMAVNYDTARIALNGLVKTGYLTVDKSPGRSHLWMLTSRLTREVPRGLTADTSRLTREGVADLQRGEGVFREKQGAPTRRSQQAASVAAGENQSVPGPALRLVADRCDRCAGTGWMVGPGGQSYECHHR
jgi:hypothetical protein